jgi:flagellar biosynthesis/type III secretory pathway ATPase
VHALTQSIAETELVQRAGQVVAVRGNIVEATGPAAQIGERCRIEVEHLQGGGAHAARQCRRRGRR